MLPVAGELLFLSFSNENFPSTQRVNRIKYLIFFRGRETEHWLAMRTYAHAIEKLIGKWLAFRNLWLQKLGLNVTISAAKPSERACNFA